MEQGGLKNTCLRGTRWVRKHGFAWNMVYYKIRVCLEQGGLESTFCMEQGG